MEAVFESLWARSITPNHVKRVFFFLFSDVLISLFSLYSAYLLRFNFSIPTPFLAHFSTAFITLLLIKLFFLYLLKNYSVIWRFYGLNDAKRLFIAHIATYTLFLIIFLFYPQPFLPFPRSVIIIDFFLSFTFLGALRFIKRLIIESSDSLNTPKSTLIFGISSNTDTLIKTLLRDGYYVHAILVVQEHNFNMIGSFIHNIKIFGLNDLPMLMSKYPIQSAIIEGSLQQDILREVYEKLKGSSVVEIKRSITLEGTTSAIEPLCVEDLLARHPKDLDTATIGEFIKNKTILITGAGGSIGSEIALQCHYFGATTLILVDHSEYNLYQISEQLPHAIAKLSNITDKELFSLLLSAHKPDIVIHAAAYKHVPLCEANIPAALLNNIQGSRNVIDCSIAHDVPKIVIISTDKAVRPTNVMGTTKRIVELYAQNVAPKNSEIVAVRFGNVLGSSGSVIPKFKAQIEAGGPLTLTHPDITRYFMLIDEACQLVLQAAAIARGGELFILDMGEPIKIIDLAYTMIKLYAKEPIEIQMTGLRAGEKLYEELLIDESEQKTCFESIMIAHSSVYPIDQLNRDIDVLLSNNNTIDLLKQIVPEFTPQR